MALDRPWRASIFRAFCRLIEQNSGTSGALRSVHDLKRLNALDLLRLGVSGVVKVPTHLQMDPKLRRRAEESGQPERGARSDASPAADDLVEALKWNLDRRGQFALRHVGRGQKLLQKHLARVRGLTVGREANHA